MCIRDSFERGGDYIDILVIDAGTTGGSRKIGNGRSFNVMDQRTAIEQIMQRVALFEK